MAVNTAGQSARPRADANISQRAAMRVNRSPQSGGDIGGPKTFPKTRQIDTSEGTIKSHFATDKAGSRNRTLYPGKAYENARHVPFTKVKGNSEGKAEISSKTKTGTVSKAAKARLGSKHDATQGRASGDELSGQPFRRSSGAFGPQRSDRVHQDHLEHQNVHGARPGRRMEVGGIGPKHLRSGA